MCTYVGTSGWQYRDWRGVLYPPGLAQSRWLEYYAGCYGTVENNGAFYRLPGPDTFPPPAGVARCCTPNVSM